jgi:phage repressor protein C with HTH and peptisase S24 domain
LKKSSCFFKVFQKGKSMPQIQPYQRLKVLRRGLDLSLKAFGTPLGVSGQAVHDWETGKTPVSVRVASTIEKAFGVPTDWLLKGNGPFRFKNLDGQLDEQLNELWINCVNTVSQHLGDKAPRLDIPLLSAQPCSGAGTTLDDYVGTDGGISFDERWLRKAFSVPPKNLRLLEVDGDSMMPTILPDEWVFVDASPAQGLTKQGVWVLRIGDTLRVKRIEWLGANKGRAVSDNPAYSPIPLGTSTPLMGRVVGHLQRFF